MRRLIIVIFFVWGNKSNAQLSYFALPDSNALWTITGTYGSWSHSRIIVKGDSLYGSNVYKKYYAVSDSNLSIASYAFIALVRQDIINKKVYAIKNGTTYERLLYNFNLSLNDSVRVTPLEFGYPGTTGYNSNGYKLKVIQKDTILINSQYRKRLKLKEYNGVWNNPEYWIEGIGSTFGILNSGVSGYIITDVCYPLLLCQKQQGVLNYLAPMYNSCIPQICTGIGVNELNNKDEELKIYPNPSNDVLNVEINLSTSSGSSSVAKLEIINSLGQVVYQSAITNIHSSINITQLPNGFYQLKLSEGESQKLIKFIKSN